MKDQCEQYELEIQELWGENDNYASELTNLWQSHKSLEKRLESSERSEHKLSEKATALINENSELKAKVSDTYKVEYLENEKNELWEKMEEQSKHLQALADKLAKTKLENETFKDLNADQ